MIIHCSHDAVLETKKLKSHPDNPNKHTDDQIERLSKILEYQGWRYPIKISKRSGFITSGHGRLAAAKLLKLKEVPVNYQDYENEEQELADLTSDNAIASWAELDMSKINADLEKLGPDFDVDLLGIQDFTIEPLDKMPDLNDGDKPDLEQITFTLSSDQADMVRMAIEKSINMGPLIDEINDNKNGNAIARVCELFLNNES